MEDLKQLIESLKNTTQELVAYAKEDIQPQYSNTLRTICAALTALAADEKLPQNRSLFYDDKEGVCYIPDVWDVSYPAYEWFRESGRFTDPPYEGARMIMTKRAAGWWTKSGSYEVDILVDAWKRETIEAYKTQAEEWEKEYYAMLKEKGRIRKLERELWKAMVRRELTWSEKHNPHTPQPRVRLEDVDREADSYTLYEELANGVKSWWRGLTLKQVRKVIKEGIDTLDIAPTITRPNLIYVKGKGGRYGVDDWRDVGGVWRVLSPDEEIAEDANTRTEPDPQRYVDEYTKERDEYQTSWRAREAEEAARMAAKEERRRHYEEQRKRAEFRKSIGLQP